MARRLTPKQEKFARLYVELGNASEAYRGAYSASKMKPETVNHRAFDLLQNGKIAAMVDQLRASHLERHEVTIDTQFDKLEHIYTTHRNHPKGAGAAVSAIKEQNAMHGLVTHKHKHDANVVVQELPPLPPDAAKAIVERLLAEI